MKRLTWSMGWLRLIFVTLALSASAPTCTQEMGEQEKNNIASSIK